MTKLGPQGTKAAELLDEPAAKGLPAKQLARILLARHPDIYKTVENARSALRGLLGTLGERHRGENIRGTVGGKYLKEKDKPHDPWVGMPPCLREFDWDPVEIEARKTAVLADLHLLHYDPMALIPALRDMEKHEPDCILLLGDLLDFYEISEFRKDPSFENLARVLEAGLDFWKRLRRRFPKSKLIWKYGNHEERWEHFMWKKAPEFCRQIPRVSELDWVMNHPSLYSDRPDEDADGLDIKVVKNPVPLTIGALYLLHGHEMPRWTTSPVNAARTAQLKLMECSMVAHSHQRSEQSERSIGGRLISSWSIGCLCQLHPRYSPFNPRWSHSFAYVEKGAGKNFLVTTRRIIGGEVY